MTLPPAAVFRDGDTWRWTCRLCNRGDWRVRHHLALAEALEHLHRHATFGFQRRGR